MGEKGTKTKMLKEIFEKSEALKRWQGTDGRKRMCEEKREVLKNKGKRLVLCIKVCI